MTILDQLTDHARERVAADKKRNCPEVMRELALQGGAGSGAAFEVALKRP